MKQEEEERGRKRGREGGSRRTSVITLNNAQNWYHKISNKNPNKYTLSTNSTNHACKHTHTHTYVHICTSHTIHANTHTHTHKVYFSINRIMCTSISTAMCTRPHAKLLHHMQSLTHFHMPVQASEASQTSSFLHSFSARHHHFHTLFTFTDFTLSCSTYIYIYTWNWNIHQDQRPHY